MSREPSSESATLSTPTAILMGSCVIALGLYFGLSSNDKSETRLPAPVVITAPKETGPVKAAAPVVDKTRIIREATAFLALHKKALTEKCLAPSLIKKPDPPKVKYLLNITFDALGRMLARGVIEDRETSRPEVLTCVNDGFPDVRVSPPGQTVLVDVPFELP